MNGTISIIEDDASLPIAMKRLFLARAPKQGLELTVNLFDYQHRNPIEVDRISREIVGVNGRSVVIADGLHGEWRSFYEKLMELKFPGASFVLSTTDDDYIEEARNEKNIAAFYKVLDADAFEKYVFDALKGEDKR